MTILLLTKSLAYEQEFVRQLNDFGHEVLSSRKFLDELQKDDYLGMDINYFDTLILSETISDQEIRQILPFFLNFKCTVFRKTISPVTSEESSKWQALGISEFISQTMRLDELREKLIVHNENRAARKWTLPGNEDQALEQLKQSFSKQELRVFKFLLKSQKKYISREVLSYELWGEAPTSSKESRLSGIIRSIKRKLSDFGFEEKCLETSWGRGYRIERLKMKHTNVDVTEELKVVES